MNFRRGAFFALALFLLPLFSSCVSVLSPTGWAPVTFDGDTAYITSSKGKLSALELNGDSATAKWTFPDKDRSDDKKLKTRAIYGAPVLDGDRVYVATFSGGVFALGKDDGRPIWPATGDNTARLDGNITGGLALAGETLFFGTTEGRLYGWKTSDGTPADGWATPKDLSGGIWTTPIVSDDTLFVATMDGELHALSVADGSERWQKPFTASGAIAEVRMLNDDLLFVPSINRHVYLIRTSDGSVAADFQAKDWVWTAPAFSEGRLYFGDFSGLVYGLDITMEGKELWSPVSVDGERVRAGAAIIDDVIVVADRKPVVTFISASNGSVLGNRVPILDAGTVRADLTVKDGAAYIATTNGKLFRAEPGPKKVVEIQLSGVKK